jgi:general secretion pathway protein N
MKVARRVAWAVFGLAVLAVALVRLAPASLARAAIEQASEGRVTLREPLGTVWRGQGTLTAGRLGVPVAWQIDGPALLHGEVAARLFSPSGQDTPRGRLAWSPAAFRVENLSVALPAQAIADALLPRPRLDARGIIRVDTPRWAWRARQGADGRLTGTWPGAAIALLGAPPVRLGVVELALQGSAAGAAGPVRNSGGELGVEGSVVVDPSGGGSVDLLLRPASGDAVLRSMLSMLGTGERGGVRVQWSWPAP